MANSIALVTGASGGIGLAIAKEFAVHGFDLVLVARNESKLLEVKKDLESQHKIEVETISLDLSLPEAGAKLFNQLKEEKKTIDVLVNNAGFGDASSFLDSSINKDDNMIDLNIKALVDLSYYFGGAMKEQGRGAIINLSSMLGLTPAPYMATYAASKAFVLSFSEALHEELKPFGVKVIALCPGPVSTGFEKAADVSYKQMKMAAKKPEYIAKLAYQAYRKNKAVVYCGALVKFDNLGSRLFSRSLTRKIVGKNLKKVRSNHFFFIRYIRSSATL